MGRGGEGREGEGRGGEEREGDVCTSLHVSEYKQVKTSMSWYMHE